MQLRRYKTILPVLQLGCDIRCDDSFCPGAHQQTPLWRAILSAACGRWIIRRAIRTMLATWSIRRARAWRSGLVAVEFTSRLIFVAEWLLVWCQRGFYDPAVFYSLRTEKACCCSCCVRDWTFQWGHKKKNPPNARSSHFWSTNTFAFNIVNHFIPNSFLCCVVLLTPLWNNKVKRQRAKSFVRTS